MVVIVVKLGLTTPQKALAPGSSIWQIYRGVAPFVASNVACLAIIVLFPEISLFLPGFTR